MGGEVENPEIFTFYATIVSPFNNGEVIDFVDEAEDDVLLANSCNPAILQ